MPRNRLIPVVLIFVLVAAACGVGDDSDPSDRAAAEPPETFTTSDSGSEGSAEVSPEVSPEADTTTDGEQMDSAAPGTASDAGPLDSTSGTEPQDSSQPVVRLGDRFEWCSGIQAVWDAHDHAIVALVAVEAGHEDALAKYEAATDELNRAEAREIVEAAQSDVREVNDKYQQALTDTVDQLRLARHATDDSTEGIAYQRAWEALSEKSSQIQAAATDLESAEANTQRADTELRQTQNALHVAVDVQRTLSEIGGREMASPGFVLDVGDRITGQAIGAAERAGADPVDVAALHDTVQARLEALWDAADARRAAGREAEEERQQSGVTRSASEISLDAGEANNAAIAAFQAMEYAYYNGVYPEGQNAAGAATAEDAVAAASRAVEHLLAMYDGYDAWFDAVLTAEIAAEDARVAPLPQDVVDASEAARAVLDTARTSFAESTEAAVSDADTYTTFKRSFEGSCQ